MTEEQKQALTCLCKIEIKRWKAFSESNPNMRYMSELMEIALAALTAPPDDWKQRAEAAEAKLAELEQQQAVGVARMELTIGREGLRYYQCFVDMRPDLVLADLNTGMELFTRPAPAADLMPGEWTNEQCLEFLSIAFRHAEISGDIEMDDIRLAVKMVNAAAPEVE